MVAGCQRILEQAVMDNWLAQRQFSGFGESLLCPEAAGAEHCIEIPRDRMQARKLLRETCPRSPGVYGWLDPHRQLHYVGKSKSLRHRLLSYFAKIPSDPKMARIRRQSGQIVWQPVSHELLALLREQELINRFRPGFNSQGQPTRRRPAYVCLTDSTAPTTVVRRQLANNENQYRFGPILGTSQLRAAIDVLNNCFGLRDCPDQTKMEFSDQLQLFQHERPAKCMRLELATCPGPCAGACSKADYQQGVSRALAFLQGFDTSVLDDLQARMQRTALHRQFEAAAVWRDRWESLAWLHRRLESLRRARMELNCVYEIPGLQGKIWLILDGGLPIACVGETTNRKVRENFLPPAKTDRRPQRALAGRAAGNQLAYDHGFLVSNKNPGKQAVGARKPCSQGVQVAALTESGPAQPIYAVVDRALVDTILLFIIRTLSRSGVFDSVGILLV